MSSALRLGWRSTEGARGEGSSGLVHASYPCFVPIGVIIAALLNVSWSLMGHLPSHSRVNVYKCLADYSYGSFTRGG